MTRKHILILVVSAAVLSGCATGVQVTHSPLVATSTEQITFTAKSFETTPSADSRRIQILVNAALVKECDYSPCTYTGGPYEDGYLHYAANVTRQRATQDLAHISVLFALGHTRNQRNNQTPS